MKLAIVGSRGIKDINLDEYILENVTEIVSGGAKGVDQIAKQYALEKGLKYKEFLPEYEKFGRSAPLKRNLQIIEYADELLIFWDGISKGTEYVIKNAKKHKLILKDKEWIKIL